MSFPEKQDSTAAATQVKNSLHRKRKYLLWRLISLLYEAGDYSLSMVTSIRRWLSRRSFAAFCTSLPVRLRTICL